MVNGIPSFPSGRTNEISYPNHEFSVTGFKLVVVCANVSAVDSDSSRHVIWLQNIQQHVTTTTSHFTALFQVHLVELVYSQRKKIVTVTVVVVIKSKFYYFTF